MACTHDIALDAIDRHRFLQLMDGEGYSKHCNTFIANIRFTTPTLTGIAAKQKGNTT